VDKRQRIHQQGVKSVDALALIHPTDRAGYLISKINHLCFNPVMLFVCDTKLSSELSLLEETTCAAR
jgi:hypothetical protein